MREDSLEHLTLNGIIEFKNKATNNLRDELVQIFGRTMFGRNDEKANITKSYNG